MKAKKYILIIDDGEDSQYLHTVLLSANGYKVSCTSNGQEALSLLRDSTELPDLILLDARMPVMDGYDFRQFQCGDRRLRNIPVVVMTGEDDIDKVRKAMMNPLKVMRKPLHSKALIELVSNSLAITR